MKASAKATAPQRWTRARSRNLESWVAQDDVEELTLRPLPTGDPWARVLPALSLPHRKIVTSGIPAFGSRTRWSASLAVALTDLVGPEEATSLLLHWLFRHDLEHVSESLATEPARVEEQTAEIVKSAYRNVRGVPVRFWREIEQCVRHIHSIALSAPIQRRFPQLGAPIRFSLDDALKTAFSVARLFYDARNIERAVTFSRFGRYVGKNHAHQMQEFLTLEAKWLYFSRPAVTGKHARYFCLTQCIWPPRPGEAVIYAWP